MYLLRFPNKDNTMKATAVGLIYWNEQSGAKQITFQPERLRTRPLLTEKGKVDFLNPMACAKDY